MTIPFFGGPYDGLKLSVVEIERHLIVLSIPTRGGPRRFLYLPHCADQHG